MQERGADFFEKSKCVFDLSGDNFTRLKIFIPKKNFLFPAARLHLSLES